MSALVVEQLRNRRKSAQRCPLLDCGCADPWPCRCHRSEPTDQQINGYRDAAELLLSIGLTPAPFTAEMRSLWRRGGSDRELVSTVSTRWAADV